MTFNLPQALAFALPRPNRPRAKVVNIPRDGAFVESLAPGVQAVNADERERTSITKSPTRLVTLNSNSGPLSTQINSSDFMSDRSTSPHENQVEILPYQFDTIPALTKGLTALLGAELEGLSIDVWDLDDESTDSIDLELSRSFSATARIAHHIGEHPLIREVYSTTSTESSAHYDISLWYMDRDDVKRDEVKDCSDAVPEEKNVAQPKPRLWMNAADETKLLQSHSCTHLRCQENLMVQDYYQDIEVRGSPHPSRPGPLLVLPDPEGFKGSQIPLVEAMLANVCQSQIRRHGTLANRMYWEVVTTFEAAQHLQRHNLIADVIPDIERANRYFPSQTYDFSLDEDISYIEDNPSKQFGYAAYRLILSEPMSIDIKRSLVEDGNWIEGIIKQDKQRPDDMHWLLWINDDVEEFQWQFRDYLAIVSMERIPD